jgi:PBP1b-binding outer membrane lipoprotein LpoB
MKKIVTFAVLAGGALVLAACGGKTEEAPAAEPTAAEPEMMAPAADASPVAEATDAAEAAADGMDPTNNPIGPAKTGTTQ